MGLIPFVKPDPPEQFPATVPLEVGVNAQDGVIVDVGPYRHRVRWSGDAEPSCVTYCNRCGFAMTRRGWLKPEIDPLQRCIDICAQCYTFQGFVSLEADGR